LLVTRCFLLAALILSGCDHRCAHTLTGRTMGTTYHIHVVRRTFGSVAGLQDSVDRRLDEINHGKCASMSPTPVPGGSPSCAVDNPPAFLTFL
jgi:hypothetical protein